MMSGARNPSNKSFPFQGLNLSYKHWNFEHTLPKSSIVIVALHGWMDNAATFDNLLPKLPQHEVVALDFSGHGLSDHRTGTGDYYLWSFAEEVVALVEHLRLEKVILLGHSMGAAVASICAALYPERFPKLLMLDVIGPITTTEEDSLDQMRSAIRQKTEISNQEVRHYQSLKEAQKSRARNGISLESAAILGSRNIFQDSEGYYWAVDRQLVRKNLMSFTEDQARVFLGKIEADALLIFSTHFWASRREKVEARIKLFQTLEVYELDGSHFQHLEGRVEKVAKIIEQFLDK